jgi:mannosyltransferase
VREEGPGSKPAARERFVLVALACAVVARLWVMPLPSSLWLDEFGPVWVTSGSFGAVLERARVFPQSLPYAGIVWLTRAALGSSEIALRIPSLLAMLAAMYCLYRLGRELFDRETGLLAAGILLLFPQIAFAAGDARPYAFALLAATAATWALVRWLGKGRGAAGAAYVALAAATVYFQYLFATVLVAHAAYALHRRRRGSPVSGLKMLLAGSALAVLLLPAAALVLEIGRGRASHAFGPMPGIAQLGSSLVPSRALGVLVASLLLCFLFRVARLAPRPSADGVGDALFLLVLVAVVPSLLLFVVSRAGGAPVFEVRYLMGAVPAQALLMAWLLGRAAPQSGRTAALGGALALVLVLRGGLSRPTIAHGNEDWRAAVAALDAVNGSGPVLFGGSFTESRELDVLKDPTHTGYLRAPLEFYRPAGPVEVLPLRTGDAAEAFVADRLRAASPGARFALIERNSRWPSWAPWLAERFRADGYTMKDLWASDTLKVRIFERGGPVRNGRT